MNYTAHYHKLINRARNRLLAGYVERHHVIPRCMDGTDDTNNIVCLTAEEHYVAHQLLVKIHPTNVKLLYAVHMMTIGTERRNNRRYGWLRRRAAPKTTEHRKNLSISHMGKVLSEEHKANLSKAKLGKKLSAEHVAKQSAGKIGMKFTEERKKNISLAKIGHVVSDETKTKISKTLTGRKFSDERRRAISKGKKGISQKVISCPHCQRTGGISAMHRYHFKNCKLLNIDITSVPVL